MSLDHIHQNLCPAIKILKTLGTTHMYKYIHFTLINFYFKHRVDITVE